MISEYLKEIYENGNPIVTHDFILTQVSNKLFSQDIEAYTTNALNIIKSHFPNNMVALSGNVAARMLLEDSSYPSVGIPDITVTVKDLGTRIHLPMQKLADNYRKNLHMPEIDMQSMYPKIYTYNKFNDKFIFSPRTNSTIFGKFKTSEWKHVIEYKTERESDISDMYTVSTQCIWYMGKGAHVSGVHHQMVKDCCFRIPILRIRLTKRSYELVVHKSVQTMDKQAILGELIWKCICSFINKSNIRTQWKLLKSFYEKYPIDKDGKPPSVQGTIMFSDMYYLQYETKNPILGYMAMRDHKNYYYNLFDMLSVYEWDPPSFNLKFEELITSRLDYVFTCINNILFNTTTTIPSGSIDANEIARHFVLSSWEMEDIVKNLGDYTTIYNMKH